MTEATLTNILAVHQKRSRERKAKPKPKLPIETIRQTRYRTEDGHVHDTLHEARAHLTSRGILELLATIEENQDILPFMLNNAAKLSLLLREYHNLQQTIITKQQG